MKKNTDQAVLELFNKVREKQKLISEVKKIQWKTSCTIAENPEIVSERINIQTVTDINKLIYIYGFLCLRENFFELSKCDLELEGGDGFSWMGYSLEEWRHDIKARIAQIDIKKQKQDLKKLEDRLDKLISQEQRREMELEAIRLELQG